LYYVGSGESFITSVNSGESVIGKLNFAQRIESSGEYTLKVDLRMGSGAEIIASDSKKFNI
jgi:hypothetical protein